MKKKCLILFGLLITMTGCAGNTKDTNIGDVANRPVPPLNDQNFILKSRAEFDVISQGGPSLAGNTTTVVIAGYTQSTTTTSRLMWGNLKAFAMPFSTTSTQSATDVSYTLSGTGTPTGNIIVKIVRDSSGSPSSAGADILGTSTPISAASIVGAPKQTNFTFNSPISLPAGNYWVIITGDSTYLSAATSGASVGVFDAQGSPLAKTAMTLNSSSVWNSYPQSNGFSVNNTSITGTCSHGSCIDFVDIQVTNTINTQFALNHTPIPGNAFNIGSTNNSLSNFLSLNIASLYDNDLFACGGNKCTTAFIRIYTTTAQAGAGLYNSINGQSIPLMVTGGTLSSSTAVPYNSTTALITDSQSISAAQQVVSLSNNFFNSSTYVFSTDFTTAGAGIFKAHVVVEYGLQ